jgi:hypothetical protein
MKKLLSGIAIFAVSVTLAFAQDTKTSATTSTSRRTWSLTITPQTKKHSLDSVKTAWAKDNVVLKFTKLEYSAKGSLMKVEGSVAIKANNSHASGTFTSDNVESVEIKLDDKPSVSIKSN